MPREKHYYSLEELSAQRRVEADAAFARHKLNPGTFEQAWVKGGDFVVLGTTYQLTIFGQLDSELVWNTDNPNRGEFVAQ